MNDSHDSLLEPSDDSLLEELLKPLKRLEPPLEARLQYRIAVTEELMRLQAAHRKLKLPWWRRRISIPVPVAACLAVVAALAVLSSYHGGKELPAGNVAAPNLPAERAPHVSGENAAVAGDSPDARPVLEYYETETYLCGIGRLKSESGYIFRNKTND